MNPNDLSQEVLQEIKDKNIKPKPRWQFQLKNWLIWLLGALSLLFGALTFTLILYFLSGNKNGEHLRAWLMTAPFFWLIIYAIFGLLVYYHIKRTKDGYRYQYGTVMLAILTLSVLFGISFYRAGLGARLDDQLCRSPWYATVFNPRLGYWAQPESGRLSGLVVLDEGNGVYRLIDQENKQWLISTETELVAGQVVRLSGLASGQASFEVQEAATLGPGQGVYRQSPQLDQLEKHHPGLGLCLKQCRQQLDFDDCADRCRELRRGKNNRN